MKLTNRDIIAFVFGAISTGFVVGVTMQISPAQQAEAPPHTIIAPSTSATEEGSVARDHPAYRLLYDWPSLFETELTPQEARESEHVTVTGIANKFTNDLTFQNAIVDYIQTNEHTATRRFFIRVISHTPFDLRVNVAANLLQSSRFIDVDAGLSIIMSIDEVTYKSQIVKQLLEQDLEHSILQRLLAYIRVDNELIESALLNQSLLWVYTQVSKPKIKAQALTALMPEKPLQDNLFSNVMALIGSPDAEISMEGMNVMNEWQVNFFGLLTSSQEKRLTHQLTQVSINLSFDTRTRMKALELINNL